MMKLLECILYKGIGLSAGIYNHRYNHLNYKRVYEKESMNNYFVGSMLEVLLVVGS